MEKVEGKSAVAVVEDVTPPLEDVCECGHPRSLHGVTGVGGQPTCLDPACPCRGGMRIKKINEATPTIK